LEQRVNSKCGWKGTLKHTIETNKKRKSISYDAEENYSKNMCRINFFPLLTMINMRMKRFSSGWGSGVVASGAHDLLI